MKKRKHLQNDPKEKQSKKVTSKKRSIRFTLMGAFAIPVLLLVIAGIVSYRIASDTVLEKGMNSSLSTVDAVGDYMELVATTLENKALELSTNNSIKDYYAVYYKSNNSDSISTLKDTRNLITNLPMSISHMYTCTILSEKAVSVTSLQGGLPENPYEEFAKSEEGIYFSENQSVRNAWMGYHHYLDEKKLTSSENYCMTLYHRLVAKNTIMIIDVHMDVFRRIADNMDFGEGSIKGLITPDGRETSCVQGQDGINTKNYFVNQAYYDAIRENEQPGITKDITIDGTNCVLFYTPVGQTGAMVAALIPETNMVGEVASIKLLTAVLVALSALICLSVGLVISLGIGNTVKSMSDGLSVLEKGDFSSGFHTNRKDEFLTLTESLNSMLESLRNLIKDMKHFSDRVADTSESVYEQTGAINTSMSDISLAMNEVAKGVLDQAEETENSNSKMISLAQNIDIVSDKATIMVEEADGAIVAVEKGKQIISDISQKSTKTAEFTKTLVENISDVQEQSEKIKNIVDMINSIATQTNLLSLNASIEAARAGMAGKGFAVVADEIRKLAEQSNESGNQIRKIVEGIGQTGERAVQSAKETEEMITEQAEALHSTVQVFTMIHETVTKLVSDIRAIMDRLSAVTEEKNDVQESIRSISAVSEEVSAATEEVCATVTAQTSVMNELAKQVEELKGDMTTLNDSIEKFRV